MFLMTCKRDLCYKQIYQVFIHFFLIFFPKDLIHFAEDNDVHLPPESIISDFELVANNTSKYESSL